MNRLNLRFARPLSSVIRFRRREAVLVDQAVGLLAVDAPSTWTDRDGRVWNTPRSPLTKKLASHRALRAFVFERDGDRCPLCGDVDEPTLDHVIAVANALVFGRPRLEAMGLGGLA